jgi:hypothetical protein
MDGDFKIRANVYALSEAEAIKGLKHAFTMFTMAGFAIVECHCEQVSATSEWMHLSQTDSLDLLNRGPGAGTEGKPPERGPTIGKFVIESKAASITAPAVLRVVPPHTDPIMPVMLTE